jgi:acetyl esterase/lipase
MSEPSRIIAANPAIGAHGDIHCYLPEGSGPFPFVIGIHGGAWRNGDQKTFRHLGPKLAPLGIALVLVSYRRRHEAPFPAAYDDLVFSLRWLKENGAGLRLDGNRCALFGSSAGGHLAMLLGARATRENLPSPVIRGILQYCGIMNPVTQYAFDLARGSAMTPEFLGGAPDEKPALYEAASPIAQLHPGMPPVWMAHGTADHSVLLSQSLEVVEKLRALQCDVTFLEARDLGHTCREISYGGDAIEPWELLFERDALRFFQRVLTPRPLIGPRK